MNDQSKKPPTQTAVHDIPADSLVLRYFTTSCFATAGGTKSGICESEVSIPYSEGIKRLTPALMAASITEVCWATEKVAIVETTASCFSNAENRQE